MADREEEEGTPPREQWAWGTGTGSATGRAEGTEDTTAEGTVLDVRQRLLAARRRIDDGQKANLEAVAAEEKRRRDPDYVRKHEREEQRERRAKWAREIEEAGDTAGHHKIVNTTSEYAGRQDEKKRKKDKKSFAWETYNTSSYTRQYKKKLQDLPVDQIRQEYVGQKKAMPNDRLFPSADTVNYGGFGHRDRKGVERVAASMHADMDRRRKRHKEFVEEADISWINEKNRVFNEKINKAFDKYTVEIKQNLERGTAL